MTPHDITEDLQIQLECVQVNIPILEYCTIKGHTHKAQNTPTITDLTQPNDHTTSLMVYEYK